MPATTQAPPGPRRRSRLERAIDAATTRLFDLPRPRTDYTVTQRLRVPMRDGVHLLADHFAPTGPAVGTVLVRTPYGADLVSRALLVAPFAPRGYHVVLVQCRGRFGSGGTFEPFMTEVDDAADTVRWLRVQPWFAGRFATYGGSYLSFTQWALLTDPPPELAAAVVQVSLHDFSRAFHPEGAIALEAWLTFAELVAENPSVGAMYWRELTAVRRQRGALAHLPVAEAAERLVGDRAPWFREYATHDDPDDPFWSRAQLGAALERAEVPVLLQTGWQDLLLTQTLEQYRQLHRRGVDVALTVGPWTHSSFDVAGRSTIYRETLEWLDEHLAGTRHSERPAPVRIHVTGAGAGSGQWRSLASWPPPARDTVLHLLPHGRLGPRPAATGLPAASFTYDPAEPTPSLGGRMLTGSKAGYRRDDALARRSDVLAFTGPVLDAALEVVGVPTVELSHASDNPHADLFLRISDVDARGRSRNVSDGFLRLQGASPTPRIVRVELDAVAHRFAAGHRIRLLVAGGSFPWRNRNLGTPDHATGTRVVPARHTVEVTGSRLHLPAA
ncbi:CocE/NonD family hydrolase [Georgenia sp. EYE_87]|uniref:CocE/NonD family hydrolase n=1 Tax=Georgenia sp. EYE_87 TaxID=2853448 RepID=UPI002002BB52|nr:CocE/NonD family hydrolase [Georgenia sp. EYE_87]MCK6211624.1 CocE/NonD family hydrolase [Georgenia sp. EYE_87]